MVDRLRSGSPVLARYRGAGIRTRVHVTLRWLSCPFDLVVDATGERRRVLDVGCGHGLLSLALAIRPGHDVVGIDPDRRKVAAATGAAGGTPSPVRFEHRMPGDLPDDRFDAIVVNDVLYLMSPARQQALLAGLAERLAPEGRLVVKLLATEPRWKHRLALAEERLATGPLGITRSDGDGLHVRPPDEVAQWLEALGLRVEQRRADRWSPWPHHLLTADR